VEGIWTRDITVFFIRNTMHPLDFSYWNSKRVLVSS